LLCEKINKDIFIKGLLLLLLYFSVRTFIRNFDWKDNDTLMSRDLKHLTNSAQANYMYASYLDVEYDLQTQPEQRKANVDKIIFYYEEAIRILPAYESSYYRIANIKKYTLKDLQSSLPYYEKTYNTDTSRLDALFEIAKTNQELQQYSAAIVAFQKLYDKNKTDTLALFYYAQCEDLSGNPQKALQLNEELMKLAPNTEYPYLNMAALQYKMGNHQKGIELYEEAVKYGTRDPNLLRQLSIHFKETGNMEKSDYYKNLIRASLKTHEQ
jgi:tetratricopeptide (TPR) repeat protein